MASRAMNKLGEEGNPYLEETIARQRVITFCIFILPFLAFGWLAADTDVLTFLFYPYVILFIACLLLIIFSFGGFKGFARKHVRISPKVVFIPSIQSFIDSMDADTMNEEERDFSSFVHDFKKSFDVDKKKYDLSDAHIIDQATHLEIARFVSTRFALNDNLYTDDEGLSAKGFLYADIYKQSLAYRLNNDYMTTDDYQEQYNKFETYLEKITKKM